MSEKYSWGHVQLAAGSILDERLWAFLVALCRGRESEGQEGEEERCARSVICERCIEVR